MGQDWDFLPDRPSPLAVDMAAKQLSIERSLARRATTHAIATGTRHTRIFLNFPAKEQGPPRQTCSKCGRPTTIEPLKGSDAPGDKASIQQILARNEPRRVRHNRRSTWVEEFLVQWGPEHCTFGEALEQYNLGFDIVSITSLEDTVPTQNLLPFVAAKRPTSVQRRDHRRPPLTTTCVVQFAPPPQGPLHLRSIAGGPQALDTFLERGPLPPSTLPTRVDISARSTPIKRSSSAQAPTRAKLRAAAPPASPSRGNHHGGGTTPSSPARLPRRPHSNLLLIILEEGDPNRDSIPRAGPYASMVPPTSPWNRLGRDMIGVHTPSGSIISPTLISP